MTEVVAEEFEHAGIPCKIILDFDAGDPRESRDTLIKFVWATHEWRGLKHDEQIDLDNFRSDTHYRVAMAARWLTLFDGNAIAVPFRIDDYGGGNMRAYLSDLDDDYCTGFVVMSRAELDVELAHSPEWDPMEYLKADFGEYASWVGGDAYGFVVADGEDGMDSCWGFYGDLDYVRTAAKEAAEAVAHERYVNAEPPDVAEALR